MTKKDQKFLRRMEMEISFGNGNIGKMEPEIFSEMGEI